MRRRRRSGDRRSDTRVELALFDGMGHSLPRPLWPEFATRIAGIAGLVDRVERQP
jgi:hypothetical protein